MECFEKHPYWRPSYGVSIEILLEQIPILFNKVKLFLKDPANEEYINGFVEVYRSQYITECNRGEKTGTQTIGETELALATTEENRNYQKSRNLSSAISHVFKDNLLVEVLQHNFTPAFAKEINGIIGEGLFAKPGYYRTTDAKPTGYNYCYVNPTEIELEMEKLFEKVNREMQNPNAKWYDVATRFFIQFLWIHPFSNGNGRTARLLLSALLCKHAIIPVSLFNVYDDKKDSNMLYLSCIDEAHSYENFKLFNSLLIESVFSSLYCFVSLLDVY